MYAKKPLQSPICAASTLCACWNSASFEVARTWKFELESCARSYFVERSTQMTNAGRAREARRPLQGITGVRVPGPLAHIWSPGQLRRAGCLKRSKTRSSTTMIDPDSSPRVAARSASQKSSAAHVGETSWCLGLSSRASRGESSSDITHRLGARRISPHDLMPTVMPLTRHKG